MGRPRTGSVRQRGNAWLASVPRLDDPRRRHEYTFATEDQARTWVTTALEDLAIGEVPTPPARDRASTPAPTACAPATAGTEADPSGSVRTLADYAWVWHHEHYVLLQGAEPGRAADVERALRLHILPAFDGPITDWAQTATARTKVITWVRHQAGHPATPGGEPPPPGTRTYSRQQVQNWLWVLREVLRYAGLHGEAIPMADNRPAATTRIKTLKPKGRKQRKTRLMSLEVTRDIAAHLNVVHQAALWLMRVAGLRISEAYGLIVANVIDDGERCCLLIEAQGGQTFTVREDDESLTRTHRVPAVKTDAAYRLIAIPAPLAQLLRTVIEAFHTDPVTGECDGQARLVPPIRSEVGGIAGFRSALKGAAKHRRGGSDHPEDYVIPHDLRKHFATDLAHVPGLDAVLRRRAIGHRAGTDVYDLVYTLDDRLKEHMAPAATEIGRQIEATISTLMIPTAHRPGYLADRDPVRGAYTDAVLEAAGWQISAHDTYITTTEAAQHLGMSLTATRRLFPEVIPAVGGPDGWLVRLDDVIAYRDRNADRQTLRVAT